MKRGLLLALVGLLLFVLFVLYQLPANQIISRMPPSVQFTGVEGTVWRGSATRLSVDGQVLGTVHWSWRPFSLVMGKMGYRLVLQGDDLDGRAGVAIAYDKRVIFDDVHVTAAAARLNQFLPNQQIGLAGEVELKSPRLIVRQGWLDEVAADVFWHDAALTEGLSMPLGSLSAELVLITPDELSVLLSDQGGPLELGGQAVVSRTHDYQVDLKLRARSDAGDNLRNALPLLGSPDATGRYTLNLAGSL